MSARTEAKDDGAVKKNTKPAASKEAVSEKSGEKSAAKKTSARSTSEKSEDKPVNSAESKAKKTAAKAAAQKKPAQSAPRKKSSEAIKAEEELRPEIGSRTPQVMKLVEQRDMVNPTILAGKSSIPRKLRGIEPLSKIMKRAEEGNLDPDEEAIIYNVTALVIDDHAEEILQRFNACDCEICIEELSRRTVENVPAKFAKLRKSAVKRRTPEVERLKQPLVRRVTLEMIRLVIRNKKRSYHD